jgi:hypothetical protein
MRFSRIWPLLSLLSFLPDSVFAWVLAIDYGADWIKASLVKPGVPFDVLLNKDSKRKIQSSVAWKNDDRMFGTDAFNLVRYHDVNSVFPDLLATGIAFPFRFVFVCETPASSSSTLRFCPILHQHLNCRGR